MGGSVCNPLLRAILIHQVAQDLVRVNSEYPRMEIPLLLWNPAPGYDHCEVKKGSLILPRASGSLSFTCTLRGGSGCAGSNRETQAM